MVTFVYNKCNQFNQEISEANHVSSAIVFTSTASDK